MRGLWLSGWLVLVGVTGWSPWSRADPPPRAAQGAHAAVHRHGHPHGHGLGHPGHHLGAVRGRSTVWWLLDLPRTRWYSLSVYGLGGIPYYRPYYGSGLFSLEDYGLAYCPGAYPWGPWVYGGPYLYGGPVVYPPVILPAETLFGPSAVQRFMGVRPPVVPTAPIVGPPVEGGPRAEPAPSPQNAFRPEVPLWAKEAVQRLVGVGDGYFAREKYAEALDRYRRAAQAGRSMAEPWFRQSFALLALGRYEAAAKAVRSGLKLDAGWPGSGFSLQRLYGNAAAMDAHLESLAHAAELQPENPDLLFLVGVFLYFSGQAERSEAFFQRAEQLTRGDKSHLRAFLDRL